MDFLNGIEIIKFLGFILYIYFIGGKISVFIIVNFGIGWRGVIFILFFFLKI